MTSLLDRTWHAPPGYRAVLTDERIYTESAEYLSRGRAERRAGDLNATRQPGSLLEWHAIRRGRRWRVTAYRLELVAIDDTEANVA